MTGTVPAGDQGPDLTDPSPCCNVRTPPFKRCPGELDGEPHIDCSFYCDTHNRVWFRTYRVDEVLRGWFRTTFARR